MTKADFRFFGHEIVTYPRYFPLSFNAHLQVESMAKPDLNKISTNNYGYEPETKGLARAWKNVKEWGEDVAYRFKQMPTAAKVGLPAAVVGGGAGVVWLASDADQTVSPADYLNGALNYNPEKPLLDKTGLPALFNYFDPTQDKALEVSFTTRLPENFKDGHPAGDFLNTVQNHAQSSWTDVIPITSMSCDGKGNCTTTVTYMYVTNTKDYRYPLDIENHFVPLDGSQQQQIRDYFDAFSNATGIPVHYSTDNPKAHVTFGNYYHDPERITGSLDWVTPGSVTSLPPGAVGADGVEKNNAMKNGFVLNEVRHDIRENMGAALGFESGDADFVSLRQALEKAGWQVPALHTNDTLYDLNTNFAAAPLFPARVIEDQGGKNTLTGSKNDDTLVTEAGYCGATDLPGSKFTHIFGDGDAYCIASGNIAVVKPGEGDDLILTSSGGAQEIVSDRGNNKIAVFKLKDGDKTVFSSRNNENELLIYSGLVRPGGLTAEASGNDIILNFNLSGDKDPEARVILKNQLVAGGIETLTVVGADGTKLYESGVRDLTSAEDWQKQLNDADREVNKQQDQALARRGRLWTNRVEQSGTAVATGPGLI